MPTLKDLQQEVEKIKQRNQRVELDKAWETSWQRKVIIVAMTYFVVVIFFFTARLPEPFINAIVPSLAFILSSASLPVFKKIYLKNRQ